MKDRPHFDPAHWPLAIASRSAVDETHLVMGDGVSLHRICLRGVPVGDPLAALIPCDALLDARLEALAGLERWLRGARRGAQLFGPTAYQARRLHLLLAILDLRRGRDVTSHMVAQRLVYPRLSIGQGASWKSSPERRRTQRLIHEAEALAAGGYRALLAGGAGRQKQRCDSAAPPRSRFRATTPHRALPRLFGSRRWKEHPMTAAHPPRYLRTPDAARRVGLSPRTLEKHRCYGTGPAYRKLGGRVVYAIDELDAWVELGRRSSTSDPGVGTVHPARRGLA